MTTQLGLHLRDAALAQSQRGREERIQRVREYLLAHRTWNDGGDYLTGDDVMRAVEALGLDDGDHRWTAHCLKGWSAVLPTAHFIPSTRPERHAAPLRQWVFR